MTLDKKVAEMSDDEVENVFSRHVFPISAGDYIQIKGNNLGYYDMRSCTTLGNKRSVDESLIECKRSMLLNLERYRGEVITDLRINYQEDLHFARFVMYGTTLLPRSNRSEY